MGMLSSPREMPDSVRARPAIAEASVLIDLTAEDALTVTTGAMTGAERRRDVEASEIKWALTLLS